MATEVFTRRGEEESHFDDSNSQGFNRYDNSEEDEVSEDLIKVESGSKNLCKAKKEYHEALEDDSLDLDTCNKLNHDWKK